MMPTIWSIDAESRAPPSGVFAVFICRCSKGQTMRRTSWRPRPSSSVWIHCRASRLEALQTLADLLAEASQEWIKALGHATQTARTASSAETEDFLTAIDRIAALEHQADDAERAVAAAAVKHARGFSPAPSVHCNRRQARVCGRRTQAREFDLARTRA